MRLLPAILVFGTAGASYVYTHGGAIKNLSPATWVSHEGAATVNGPAEVERLAAAPKEEVVAVTGPEVSHFAEIFRFDLSPQAIARRWSRVSTGLSDARLAGYRVPLVTGTSDSDLAGSVTYYFDNRPRLRRITFLGTTGNPQRLVEFLSRQYGFRRVHGENARVMTYRVRWGHTGILHVVPSEVLDKHYASTNYRVELSLER